MSPPPAALIANGTRISKKKRSRKFAWLIGDDVTGRRGRPPKDLLNLRPADFRRYLFAEAEAELAADLAGEDAPLPDLGLSKFHVGTKQRRRGPGILTERHLQLIGEIVNGAEPYAAAALLGLQKKAVRRLFQSTVFVAALDARKALLSPHVGT